MQVNQMLPVFFGGVFVWGSLDLFDSICISSYNNRTTFVNLYDKTNQMAAINFLYRSRKKDAFLTVRLLHTEDGVNYDLAGKTKEAVSKSYWEQKHHVVRLKDAELANFQLELNTELNKITNYLLKAFDKITVSKMDQSWLKIQMELYYSPHTEDEEIIPTNLIEYFDYYLDYRKNELKETSRKKYNVVKHKLERLQTHRRKPIFVSDVNDKFKNEFVAYCKKEGYSQNTIQRALVSIKTVCKHGRFLGLETHQQLDMLKLEREKVKSIYLTPEEIKKIHEVELNESLDNVRDWLLISYYTGQRISDFMTFTKSMIRMEDGKTLLEFTQKKTGKLMTIPVKKEVRVILEKRKGNFPKALSDANYNLYIKTVGKKAKIDQVVKGAKKQETKEGSKVYRKLEGSFPKYELMSSHIGRRSFSTNNYGKIPTSFLIYMTGHSTESLFLAYIHKSNKDLALQVADYFE